MVAPGTRSIVVRRRSSERPEFIDDGHALYHTLAYPLLFPTGRTGWHDSMVCWHRGRQHRVSLLEWSRFTLMHRDAPTFVQRCERLALEFYCDLYAQYEARCAAFHSLPMLQQPRTSWGPKERRHRSVQTHRERHRHYLCCLHYHYHHEFFHYHWVACRRNGV